MVQESPPCIFVLARQMNRLQNGLDLNEEHTNIKESFQKTTTIGVPEVTIYEGNSVKADETNPRWLNPLKVGVQVVSILLLLLTALLAGISRYGEGNSKILYYYFVSTGKKIDTMYILYYCQSMSVFSYFIHSFIAEIYGGVKCHSKSCSSRFSQELQLPLVPFPII